MGLLRTAARTAVITGTATRVHGRVAAKQQGQWAEQTAAPPVAAPQPVAQPVPAQAAAPASPVKDTSQMISQLKELGELRDAGVLTEAEFEVQKARILHA